MSEGSEASMVETRNSNGGGSQKKAGVRMRHKGTQTEKPIRALQLPNASAGDEDGDDEHDIEGGWSDIIDGLLQNAGDNNTIAFFIEGPDPQPRSQDPDYEIDEENDDVNKAASGSKHVGRDNPDNASSQVGKRSNKRKEKPDNPAANTYDREHARFYNNLTREKKARIAKQERQLTEHRGEGKDGRVPTRFRLLESEAPATVKARVMSKVEGLFRNDCQPAEKAKLTKWLDAFLKLPYGIRSPLPVSHDSPKAAIADFVVKTKDRLDKNIHGHADAKEQIIRTLAKWISNPDSRGKVIGIQGAMGVGKTTLVKNCIAEALGLPMVMIPLGGVTDASVLTGHMYTYEGSTCGAVANAIMSAKCMNPVMLLDELDKVGGDNHRGQEVYNVLIHLTDPIQNESFVDHYFADVPLDLSKTLMVFTFNHLENINPILRDRMTIIRTDGYKMDDKKKIATEHLLPKICAQHGMEGVTIEPDAVEEIVNRVEPEAGVRNLERALELIVGNINLGHMLEGTVANKDIINADLVKQHVADKKSELNPSIQHIYI